MSNPTRLDALTFLRNWYADHPVDRPHDIDQVLDLGKTVAGYLGQGQDDGRVIVRLRIGAVTNRRTGAPVAHTVGGATMQLHDDEQVSYTLSAVDAKGQALAGDTFNAASDNETVVTIAQQDDGSFLAVAGTPGSATLTFSDGSLSVTEAIDVIAGDAVAISVTAGTVEKQAPAAPAAP
jgi:hypothetical protein